MSKRRDQEALSLKESLDRYLKAMGMDKKVHEAMVLSKWPEIVGEPVNLRTEKLSLNGEILIVEMNSAVMRDELMQSKSKLIKQLNEIAGFELVKDIFFK